jgi:hypothetical protein
MFILDEPIIVTTNLLKIPSYRVQAETLNMEIFWTLITEGEVTKSGNIYLAGDEFISFYNTWVEESQLYDLVASKLGLSGTFESENGVV